MRYLLILSVFLFFSCKKEPILSADNTYDIFNRFSFPQGTREYDEKIVDIYNQFGVKVLYKDFEKNDFSLSWTSQLGTRLGYNVSISEQENAIKFIVEHIFYNLTPQITKNVLPNYFFIADSIYQYSYYPEILEVHNPINYIFDGFDFWAFSWNRKGAYINNIYEGEIVREDGKKSPDNSFSKFYQRGVILKEVFKDAVLKGNIKVPQNFNTGFDFTTTLSTIVNNTNYYYKRGFPGRISSQQNFNIVPITNITNTNERQNFIDYIHLCMRYTPDSIEVRYPKTLYPVIHEKYPIVIEFLKEEYGIDLFKIANKPND